jgi:hypothetical protein
MSVFPSKVNFVTGDILTATDMNEIGQAINSLDGAQTSGAKNRVLNGSMNVWQRGTSISNFGFFSLYTADRWKFGANNSGRTISRQLTADTTNLPNIQYCARVQRDSGQTDTTLTTLCQSFESINSIPLAGKTVTLSFYARRGANYSSASNALTVKLETGTGTDQDALAGYTGGATTINTSVTLTTTWQRFTATATIPITTKELAPYFQYNPVGTAGAADYFEITGVQLEEANSVSNYAPNGATYQAELAACQRYYWRSTGFDGARYSTGLYESATNFIAYLKPPVTMRVAATALDYAGLRTYDSAAFIAISNVTLAGTVQDAACVNCTVSGATTHRPGILVGNAATSFIGLSAEL